MATHAHTMPERRPATAPHGGGRRSLFSAVTALACMPVLGVSAVPDPDAGLIRLCSAFHDANARSYAASDDGAEWKAWLDRRWESSDAIEAVVPVTHTGRQAKARVALVLMEELADTENASERFALVALRELAGSAAA